MSRVFTYPLHILLELSISKYMNQAYVLKNQSNVYHVTVADCLKNWLVSILNVKAHVYFKDVLLHLQWKQSQGEHCKDSIKFQCKDSTGNHSLFCTLNLKQQSLQDRVVFKSIQYTNFILPYSV